MTDLERLRLIPERAAGELLGVSIKTLQNWRSTRKGPPFSRIGRTIRYRVGDILDLADAGRVDPGAVPRRGRPAKTTA